MNKRIQELQEQAGWPKDTHQDDMYQVVGPDFANKFAELIVRECMTIGFNTVYKVDDDRNAVAVYQNIKEHFGVEE
jgi:hypothetical protein